MDISEIDREGTAPPGLPAAATPPEQRWRELVHEISAEIAAPLTTALERVHALTSSGRIDRAGLRALRAEIEQARQVGMAGQQLARIASGRLRQSHERVQLADTLSGVIAQRGRETQSRGIVLEPSLRPAEVIVDASLLFGLLNTLLDWALANARSQVELRIETDGWPAQVRLHCRFAHRHVGEFDDGGPRLDSLHWRLLEQTASAMKLAVAREDSGNASTLAIGFPRTAGATMEGVTTVDMEDGFLPSANSKPLAGSHVLVITAQRDVRTQVRDAVRHMGLIIDFVASVEEAEAFCRDGLPHAILVESAQRGERFEALREDIAGEVPGFVFIELLETGGSFEISSFSGAEMARVGGDAIASALPSALMFELSRTM